MKFKKLKKLIAKTDYIRIVEEAVNEDSEYLSSEFVPDKYDDYHVIGFSHAKHISVSDHKELTGDGVEVVLQKKGKKSKNKDKDKTSKIENVQKNKYNSKKKKPKNTEKSSAEIKEENTTEEE